MVSFGTFLPKPCLFAVRWPNSWFSRLLGDDISDILVPGWWVGSFWGVFCLYFASSTVFVPAGSAILNVLVWCRTFRIFDRNFLKLLQRRLPDVTHSHLKQLTRFLRAKLWVSNIFVFFILDLSNKIYNRVCYLIANEGIFIISCSRLTSWFWHFWDPGSWQLYVFQNCQKQTCFVFKEKRTSITSVKLEGKDMDIVVRDMEKSV